MSAKHSLKKSRTEHAVFPLWLALDLSKHSKRKLVAESGISIHFLRLMHKALKSLPAATGHHCVGGEAAEIASGALGDLTQEMVTDVWEKVLIGQARSKRVWEPEHLALLGKIPDAQMVEIIGNGIPLREVLKKRRELKIPDFTDGRKSPPPRAIDARWTEAALSRLGKESDREVAKNTGIPHWSVQRMREKMGVDPFKVPEAPWNWTDEQIALLGTISDADVAERIGMKILTYRVKNKRLELGIRLATQNPDVNKFKSLWTSESEALLGTMSDEALAKKIGSDLTWSAVRRKRISKGIDPVTKSRRPAQE